MPRVKRSRRAPSAPPVEPAAAGAGFEELFLIVQEAIGRQQMMVLEWLAADPATLLDAFDRAGGDRDLFLDQADDRSDFDAIYVAMVVARQHGRDRDAAALLARNALRNVDCWSDADDFGGGWQWTAKRLARLFEATYPSAGIVEQQTKKLIDLRRRQREAREHLDRAHRLLAESLEDMAARAEAFVSEEPPRPMRVAVHIRRRKGNGVCHVKRI